MDQVNQENDPNLSSQIEVNYQDKSYLVYLEKFVGRVKISFTIDEESHLMWQQSYSVDQSYKINKSFLQYENLQETFEYFEHLIKEQIKTISLIENNLVVEFEIELVGKKSQFGIQLIQCEFDTKEVITRLSEQIINVKKQAREDKLQLEQVIKDQSILIQQMKQQLVLHDNYIENHKKKQEEKEALKKLNTNIIEPKELNMIKAWVSDQQIDLNLIYKATIDGFEIEKIYEKCKDKKRVILLIKTTQGTRFGFYSDLEIKNYDSYQEQNPNNIFLFSLDLKQKYTSNDSNCPHAFYSNKKFLVVGGGDILLKSNSNSNNNSYVSSSSYGHNQRLTEHTLNGGNYNFQTTEVEIFEIVDF